MNDPTVRLTACVAVRLSEVACVFVDEDNCTVICLRSGAQIKVDDAAVDVIDMITEAVE